MYACIDPSPRLRRALSHVLLVGAFATLLAAPSIAAAASFSAATPAPDTTVTASPAAIAVTASSATPILGTAVVTVDGNAIPASLSHRIVTAGYWAYDDYEGEYYWVDPIYDYTQATVSCAPGVLSDGRRTVVVTLPGGAGSTSWAFGIAEKPAIGAVSPASGSTTMALEPAVTAVVSDNTGVSTWITTIDGVTVPATLDGSVLQLQPGPLANLASHTVAVTAVDAAGNQASKTWTFTINSPVTTWSAEKPARDAVLTVRGAQIFEATVQCSSPLYIYTRTMMVDGVRIPDTSWTWTGATAGKVMGYEFSRGVSDGLHTVAVSIANAGGTTSTNTWTYSVQIAPKLGTPVPSAGSIVTTDNPEITVPASDNGVIALATATVNGAPAPAAYDAIAKKVRVSLASRLPDDAVTTVDVSVTDAVGQQTNTSWSFEVQGRPVMANADCTSCHLPAYWSHFKPSRNCLSCHAGHGDPLKIHTTADVTGCKPCHDSHLAIEHNREGVTCASCHNSANPDVVAAITAGNSQCSGCHVVGGGGGHETAHSMTTSTTVLAGTSAVCGDCHDASLTNEHAKASASSAAAGCDACHPSPRDTITALDPSTCVQAGCHQPSTATEMHGTIDTAHTAPPASCFDTCHNARLDLEHTAQLIACTACHRSTDPRVSAAMAAGNTECSSCHDLGSGSGHESAHAMTTSSTPLAGTTAVCGDCHASSLTAEHSKVSASSSAAGCDACHPSPRDTITALDPSTCVQAGCHQPATAYAMHGTIDTAHNSSSAGCLEACHNARLDTEHTAQSIACLSCHASTDPTISAAVAAGDTACSACHGADHATDAAFCATCHTPALRTYPGSATYALTRHSTVSASTVALVEYPGTTLGAGVCGNCHGSHSSTRRAVGNDLCFACHDGAGTTKPSNYSYQASTVYSTSAHNLYVSSQQCGTCHAVHGAEDGSGLVPSGLIAPEPSACAGTLAQPGCHADPANARLGTNVLERFTANTTTSTAHHDVYESTADHIVCTNCHNPHRDTRVGRYSDPANIGLGITGISNFCMACHSATPPAGSSTATNIAGTWSLDAHGTWAGAGFSGTLNSPYTRGYAAIACSTCHDAHGTSNIYHIKNTINGRVVTVTNGVEYQSACLACHSGGVTNWHQPCATCHSEHPWVSNVSTSSDCAVCHAHGKEWVHVDPGPCHGCGDGAGALDWNTF